MDRAFAVLVGQGNVGLLFPHDVSINSLRAEATALAARYRLPAIYGDPALTASGGLVAYASDRMEIFRRAASYVDRILRGEKPGDLPVQQPTSYRLMINLRAARLLGLSIPQTLLVIADEVIE